jgi:hypothetical protein
VALWPYDPRQRAPRPSHTGAHAARHITAMVCRASRVMHAPILSGSTAVVMSSRLKATPERGGGGGGARSGRLAPKQVAPCTAVSRHNQSVPGHVPSPTLFSLRYLFNRKSGGQQQQRTGLADQRARWVVRPRSITSSMACSLGDRVAVVVLAVVAIAATGVGQLARTSVA